MRSKRDRNQRAIDGRLAGVVDSKHPFEHLAGRFRWSCGCGQRNDSALLVPVVGAQAVACRRCHRVRTVTVAERPAAESAAGPAVASEEAAE